MGLADRRDLWQRWEENLEQPLPLLPELRRAAGCELASHPCVLSPLGAALYQRCCLELWGGEGGGDHLLQTW